MRKITYLLSLFLLMVGTAMAETIKQPSTVLLTVSGLNDATADVHLAIKCISGTNSYWFCGNKSVNSTTDQEIVWVWEPTGDGTTHYLKKYAPTTEQGDGYLQTTYGFGAQATAQKFVAVAATLPDASDSPVAGTNTDAGYVVRFAKEDNSSWINVQQPTGTPLYNTGTGLFTMYNVYEIKDVVASGAVTDLDFLSSRVAYTLVTGRSQLTVNNDGTELKTANDVNLTFDSANSRFHFAILKDPKGQSFLYSISAGKFVGKTGSLSDSPSDPLLFKTGKFEGTFVLYFDNSHFINMGGSNQLTIDGWGPGGTTSGGSADIGNSYTITAVDAFDLSAELLAKLNSVDVTFRYMVGTSLYLETTKSLYVGTVLAAANFTDVANDYVTVDSWDVTDAITENGTTVTVTCSAQELPFVVSESYDNATWYLVDMHSNDSGTADVNNGSKNYVWTATTDASAITSAEVTLPKYDTKQSVAFDDNMLWCFVGNIVDGFKIYNKAAGAEYALAKPETGNTAVKLAAVADATSFRIYNSGQITGATCFRNVNDTHYINTQAVSGSKVLRGWTNNDGGSSCRFFAPDYYLLRYAADVAAGPVNALGAAQYFNTEGKFDAFNAVVDAANANHFDATATANLAAFLTDYASDEANATANNATVADGGYYRLMNAANKTYLTSGLDGTANALYAGLAAADAPATAGTIVKVVADGTNYKLYVQGLEVGTARQGAGVNLTEGGVFTISNMGSKFTLKDTSEGSTDFSYLHYQAHGDRVVGWEDVDASKWYMIPATSVALNLNRVDEKTYATTYLPFDVTLPADGSVKAYIMTAAADGVATVAEVADVPAGQGVILEGQTGDVAAATLTIAAATADCTGNLLKGTNPRFNIEETAKADYYILGNGTNGVGFYHPNSTTLKENRAFLRAANVTGQGVNGFRLDFGGQTTAISGVEAATEGSAAVYDLSGRRVVRPAKGIYVKNGKKVYVK